MAPALEMDVADRLKHVPHTKYYAEFDRCSSNGTSVCTQSSSSGQSFKKIQIFENKNGNIKLKIPTPFFNLKSHIFHARSKIYSWTRTGACHYFILPIY